MKKLYLFTIALLMSAAFSFAQNVNVGAHGALNLGTWWGDDTENIAWGVGFFAGATVKVGINDMFSVVPEAGIEMRSIDGDGATFTTINLDIPLMLRFNPIRRFFLEAGPTLAFVLSDDISDCDNQETEDVMKSLFKANTFEFGLAFGAGFSVTQRLDLNFRFNFALTDTFDDTVDFDAANFRFAWGVTYWFI